MWQEIIVYVILGLIVFYVIFRLFFKKRKTKDKGCDSCPLKNNCNR